MAGLFGAGRAPVPRIWKSGSALVSTIAAMLETASSLLLSSDEPALAGVSAAAADLVELREAEPVDVEDGQDGDVQYDHADFDDSGGDEPTPQQRWFSGHS